MNRIHDQTLLDDMLHHQELPLPMVKQAAREILDLIREGLIRDGVVNISNFGSFRLKQVAERHGVNPQTRIPITIPAHQRVLFTPCKALRELIEPNPRPPIPIEPDVIPDQSELSPLVLLSASPSVAEHIENGGTATSGVSSVNASGAALHISGDVPEGPAIRDIGQAVEKETNDVPVYPQRVEHAADIFGSNSDTHGHVADTLTLDLGRMDSDVPSRRKRTYTLVAAAVVIFALTAAMLLIDIDEEIPHTASVVAAPSENTLPSTPAGTDVQLAANSTKEEPVVYPAIAQSELSGVAIPDGENGGYYFSEKQHEISPRENLWRLAEKYYREPLLWPHIFQANRMVLTDPDIVEEGMTLHIPNLQGGPDTLTSDDRKNISEGYYLAYMHYKQQRREEAIFALLVAMRYDEAVVERYQSQLRLSAAEKAWLAQRR